MDISPNPSSYPSFTPEMGSFNKDKFQRSAHTFSDKQFQLLTKFSESDSPELYKKAILEGVDLFKQKTNSYSWVTQKSRVAGSPYVKHMKTPFKDFKDPYSVRHIPPQEWDQFLHIYGPTKIFNKITQLFQYIYYILTREQPHSALFTYYYFSWYFLFHEYILENVYLYFPLLRVFFSNQIFSTFEGVYFSFFQIILGIFIPIFLIFIFSQYALMRSFFSHRSYFVAGSTIFFYSFTLPFIYYFTGFSNLFIFFIFFIFFSIFSVFYLFEFRPSFYFDQFNFNSYSSYFLPMNTPKEEVLFLPKYQYRFSRWPTSDSADFKSQSGRPKKVFTKFPFTQNVRSMFMHSKRIARLRILEISLNSRVFTHKAAPVMSMSGLVFPKIPNNHAYGIQSYRKFIASYPQKRFSPFAESTDHDHYDNFERDYFPIYVRDFINHSEGYSQISFVEFVSKNKSFRSFDSQFALINDEEYDFYNSIPSKKAMEYLYPFLYLKIWLGSISLQSDQLTIDEDFKIQNLVFEGVGGNSVSVPSIIPFYLVKWNDSFFTFMRRVLDRITFYAYKKFPTPRDTIELLDSLRIANKILIDTKRLSPLYYKNLFIFLVRSVYHLKKTFFKIENLSISQLFTYMVILRQIEEIYFNVNQRIEYLDRLSLDYRVGNFFLIKFRTKLDGFSQIKLSKK